MIKLKRLMEEDESQKYTVLSDKLRNSLKELHESKEYNETTLSECISLDTFTMLAEWVSLKTDDLYPYISTGIVWYEFRDKNNIKHEIKLTKGINDRYEVKLWWWNEKTNKPDYSPPGVYNKLKYDTRIFNTHIYILLNELLPYFFKNLPTEKLFLPATDKLRYRLYKITLNNHLDKTKYELTDVGDNTLVVSLLRKDGVVPPVS